MAVLNWQVMRIPVRQPTQMQDEDCRYALLLGHPGHELRVLGWASRQRPAVSLLTDGSGSEGESRVPMSLEVLDAIGCRTRSHGGLDDAGIYAAILAGRIDLFLGVAEQFADWLQLQDVDRVVSDGVEGYNPTHDLCAAMTACAVRKCVARNGRDIKHYTFPLVGPSVPAAVPDGAIVVELDESEVAAKLALSRGYAARAGGALVAEVEEMIERLGTSGFAREMLAPADLDRDFAAFVQTKPFYESYGEKKVAAGVYAEAIRFEQHMLPILDALQA